MKKSIKETKLPIEYEYVCLFVRFGFTDLISKKFNYHFFKRIRFQSAVSLCVITSRGVDWSEQTFKYNPNAHKGRED